jgi:Sec-independent protein translocase protein TatA
VIGWGEAAVVFLIVLIFLGPKHIPEAARMLARVMHHFREAKEELRRNLSLDDLDRVERDFRDTWRSPRSVMGSIVRTPDSDAPSEESNDDQSSGTVSPEEDLEKTVPLETFDLGDGSGESTTSDSPPPSETEDPTNPEDAG